MPRQPERPPSRRRLRVIAAAMVAASVLVLAWWTSGSRTTLSDEGYDVTLALYRVCNQRSQEGLTKIEGLLNEPPLSDESATATREAIHQVVSLAKAGDWSRAQTTCRRMLDDQTVR